MTRPARAVERELDADGLRAAVEALAAMERGSAGPGERASAEWVRDRLERAGAADARLQRFRYQSTFAYAHAAHFGAGLAAAAVGGPAGAALALATLVSFDLEFSGRAQWLRRVLPAGEGTNVLARVPPGGGERRRTVVLVAHHDAARTGLMWDPRLFGLRAGHAERTGKVDSFATLPTVGLALAAAGGALGGRTGAAGLAARCVGGAILATALALALEVTRGGVVPGASDNASGAAGLIVLAERYAREPLDGCEVVLVAPGCEEAGMGGMAAWVDSDGAALDRETTLVVGLDTIGAGEPVVLAGEGPLRTERYREEDIAWARRGAERAGERPPRRWRMGGWTDPIVARFAGLRAVSLLSIRDGGFPNYHLPTDTPENVDWESVERCTRIAAGIVEDWAAR